MTGGATSPRRADIRRADIQGLRAVAVVAVICFHVLGWPAGGYLGVDAFFVVSGFVITGVLLRAQDPTGAFSLRAFWARRARRILPLALVVIGAVVAVLPWAYAPAKVAAVRLDALFAALFTANWRFAASTDSYFDQGSAPSPLLHFWSLGVEEQFYLVWPIVVLGLALGSARRSRHRAGGPGVSSTALRLRVAATAVAIGTASVVWAALQAGADSSLAYYSTLTRAWELALGCALATIPAGSVRLSPMARTGLSWIGLVVLLATCVVATPETGVPYPAAIGACVGTAMVLLAGIGRAVRGSGVLTNRASGYVGDISYGLYLWHFPLVVLAPVVLATSPDVSRVVVLVTTLVLAVVSHHLVERPILDAPHLRMPRDRRDAWRAWWVARRRGMLASALTLALVIAGVGGTASARPDLFSGAAGPILAGPNGPGTDLAPDAATPQQPVAPATPAAQGTRTATPSASTSAPTTTRRTSTPAPQPSWQPIPLGGTGQEIQEGLRRALEARSWPRNLNPSPDDWSSTAHRQAEQRGCTATDAEDPDSCTFGNRKGPEVVVYGDSLGVPLLTTVVEAYGDTHKVRGMTKIACAVNGVDADFGKDEWAIPCVNHREMVVDYVRRARPAVLIMVESYAWALRLKSGSTGSANAREWLRADQDFIDSVKGRAGKVVVLSPSIPGVAFLDCYRPGGSPQRCTTGIPSWWSRTRDAEKKVKDATFVDTTHWYCVDGSCPLFNAATGTVLKGDYLHVSAQYARQLAPDLRHLLSESGVLPE
ncbi:acyltransferase family protein [Intrasporangium sp.]|uniref:acyltransferase family protein n=1 Tax=Intrasporangium sp. TaxID=1925024 RepID=UPI00293AAB40|nr:acyltransferase family protein [Intrasporangium sp.]MDV3221299.1 acyltransferase [Intrasporangium sp.]